MRTFSTTEKYCNLIQEQTITIYNLWQGIIMKIRKKYISFWLILLSVFEWIRAENHDTWRLQKDFSKKSEDLYFWNIWHILWWFIHTWVEISMINRYALTINSLAPARFVGNFRWIVFKVNLVIVGWGICYEIAFRWLSLDLTDDGSTLVQVMAWCHQAPSHYLNQCWPSSVSPYGFTGPQWVEKCK